MGFGEEYFEYFDYVYCKQSWDLSLDEKYKCYYNGNSKHISIYTLLDEYLGDYPKKDFLTLSEYREQQINSILDD